MRVRSIRVSKIYEKPRHGMATEACLKMHTGLILLCLVLVSTLVSANPYQHALENVRCKLNSYRVAVEQPGCDRKEVWLNTCVGVCIGSSVPDRNSAYNMISTCDSCKILESIDVYVELFCRGNAGTFTKYHRVRSASSCHCSRCN